MVRRVLVASLVLLALVEVPALADTGGSISITGQVAQPLNLSVADLGRFEPARVRLNNITRDGEFHGVFMCEGPTLRSLLEVATVQKGDTDFSKAVDLAILVTNERGERVALSWGEVFYKNPANVILSTKATPVMPHRECDSCHTPDVFEPWLGQLTRQVGLPQLVIAGDLYADRCIEDVASIEVVDLHPVVPADREKKLYSPGFTVGGEVAKPLSFKSLSSYRHVDTVIMQVGDGKGYHGIKQAGGVPLTELLEKACVKADLASVFIASAPDGYRSLVSYGELLLGRDNPDVIIADTVNGKPIDENGKFNLVVPGDLAADRWVKALAKINVVSLAKQPKLYVIGMGCGDTELLTLEAISYLAKADALVCPDDLHSRFAKYLGDKPVLFDPIASIEQFVHEASPGLSPAERKKLLREKRATEAQRVAEALSEGKSVAFLDYGDPMIFGSWRFLSDFIDAKSFEFVPGVSSFNAGSALIAEDVTCNGSVILTEPYDLAEKESMIESIAANGDTLAIFMGLKEFENLMPLLARYFSDTTPVALVYEAGYPPKERVVRTTLKDALAAAREQQEKWLGLIYIGACLGSGE